MPVAKKISAEIQTRPRVLIVDDEPDLVELVGDVLSQMDCRPVTATTIAEAKIILASQEVEVLLTDVHLPDGDGTSLLAALHRRSPGASAIVITGSPKLDNAISAMRQGAIDFLPKPFGKDQLVAHIEQALHLQAKAAREHRKVQRLRVAVKRLGEARRMISKKVDLLCNDLIGAYGELSRQLDDLRSREGFRKVIAEAKDLEQLLCHAMDWLLRQVGYSNVAVWLAGDDGEFQLGAYMKYTLSGEPSLVEALRKGILPLVERDGLDTPLRLRADKLKECLSPAAFSELRGQDVLSIGCTYLGEPLAALVLFRDQASSFSADDEALLKAIAPIFAVALASIVRDAPSEEDVDADNADEPDSGGLTDGPDATGRKRAKRADPADWWKTGDMPPF